MSAEQPGPIRPSGQHQNRAAVPGPEGQEHSGGPQGQRTTTPKTGLGQNAPVAPAVEGQSRKARHPSRVNRG